MSFIRVTIKEGLYTTIPYYINPEQIVLVKPFANGGSEVTLANGSVITLDKDNAEALAKALNCNITWK